jgi:uncharacterized protein (UPF0332 family)
MDDRIEPLLKKAQKYLQSAAVLLELEDFDSCVSRGYFAMFYAAQAALMKNGGGMPSNSRLRHTFIDMYVGSGLLPQRAGEAFNKAADLQELGDYGQDFLIDQESAEYVLQEAEAFVNSIARIIT